MKNNYLFLIIALLFFAACNTKQQKAEKVCGPGEEKATVDSTENEYELVWSEEFDYTGLPDSTKWSYDVGKGPNDNGWGNWELQYYTEKRKENVWVDDGILTITARKEKYEGMDYTSVRLVTRGKGDWLYGRFEIRAKICTGVGTWSAIWMLPTDWEYGNWPMSGEIDIMEHVGYSENDIFATAHTEKQNGMIKTQISGKIGVPTCYDEFHDYVLEWEPDEFRVYVDDRHYYTHPNDGKGYENWPFDKRFYLILNLAVGGSWGGEHGVEEDIWPRTMEVDYVRVYQK